MQILNRLWFISATLLTTGVKTFGSSSTVPFVSTCGVNALSTTSTCSGDMSDSTASTVAAVDETSYTAGTSSVAFVTTPDAECAKKLAHGLVEKKLAACVNIIPKVQSIYMWEGKVNEDTEFLMMIKTRTSRIGELTKWVRENHPYSVAEIIALPIEAGNVPYLSWIAQTVPEKK